MLIVDAIMISQGVAPTRFLIVPCTNTVLTVGAGVLLTSVGGAQLRRVTNWGCGKHLIRTGNATITDVGTWSGREQLSRSDWAVGVGWGGGLGVDICDMSGLKPDTYRHA